MIGGTLRNTPLPNRGSSSRVRRVLVKHEVKEMGWTVGQACASTSCAAWQVLSDYELLLICLPTEESYVPAWGMLPSFISPDCCAVAGGGLDPQRQCMTIKLVPHNQGVLAAI